MDWFPPIYVMCNPHYEPERFKFLVRHFEERGIPSNKIQYVYGPWGTEITSELKIITTKVDTYTNKYFEAKSVTYIFKEGKIDKIKNMIKEREVIHDIDKKIVIEDEDNQ